MAIATLTFTFIVGRVFDTPLEPAASSDESAETAKESVGQVDLISFVSIGVVVLLILLSAVCAVFSLKFKALYRRDDVALARIEHASEEATP